jgi:uncharacterized membrane protein
MLKRGFTLRGSLVPLLVAFALVLPSLAAVAQDEITPLELSLTLYSDGNVKVTYRVESDPSKARVDVDLFGSSYVNLVVRDEEGNPLALTATASGIKVDSLGATELTVNYYTSTLTVKEGPIWAFNITTPIQSTITLPQGAAIFDLSHIPLDIGTVGGLWYIEMPAGDLSIYYVIGLPNVQQETQSAIQNAQTYIEGKEAEGYVFTAARTKLESAQDLYQQQSYVEAKTVAEEAKQLATSTVAAADDASTQIALATDAVQRARDEGRTDGLSEAEGMLGSASQLYKAGSYSEAGADALQAAQLAFSSKAPSNTLLYLGVVVLAAAVSGGYVYMKRVRVTPEPAVTPAAVSTATPTEVDLDRIFDKHESLRLEDKEVLRFLAENSGEAFASEVRDRFDLPRSTAWRLIRRLMREGIVEEVKIGNQSLVRVRKEFHKG